MSTSWKNQTMGNLTSTRQRRYRSQNNSSFSQTAINQLDEVAESLESEKEVKDKTMTITANSFPPNPEMTYTSNSLLTIRVNGKNVTRSIGQWVTYDPKNIARIQNKYDLELDPHLNRVLFEKMRRLPNTEKKFLGLKLNIDFPGYKTAVPASVPYNRFPVKFYKWWLKNKHQITLSFKEKLELLNKVNMLDQKVLEPEHQAMMNRN